jgi:DHA1 family bicyclomycin/chloramphenicol resistance-like MFS transporter
VTAAAKTAKTHFGAINFESFGVPPRPGTASRAPTSPHLATAEHVLPAPLKSEPSFAAFVALMALMMGTASLSIDSMLPAFDPIAAAFGIEDNRIQYVVYAYLVGFGALQLVYGPLSDVLGRRRVVLAGLFIFCLGSLFGIIAPTFELLLVARAVQGAGAAACRILVVAIVRDRFEGREMARVMSLTMMVFIMVPVIAPAVGSAFLLLGSWHYVFIGTLAGGAILMLWFGLRMPETLHPEHRRPFSSTGIVASFKRTMRERISLGYTIGAGLMFGCLMAYVGNAQQILETDVYGLGSLFPLAFGSMAIAAGIGALSNSRLVRRYGMRRLSHGALCCILILSAAQIPLVLAYDGKPPLWLFCAWIALALFFFSLTMPNFNAMAMQPLGDIAGTAASFIGFLTTAIGTICGLLIAQAFDGTILPLILGFVALSIACLLVTLATERGKLFQPQTMPVK